MMSIENPIAAVTEVSPRRNRAVVGVPSESRSDRQGLLRGDGERNHQVSSIELFFDLVYVFAVTQISRFLLDHLSL